MIIEGGSTDVSLFVYFVDDVGGTKPGEPTTGLLFSDIETGGSASYARQGAARVDLELVTLASASASHTDGGFILVDNTNMPGLYRVDFPDAAFAAGVDMTAIQLVAASGKNTVMRPLWIEIGTVQTDLDNATDGLGALKTLIDALNDISAADVNAQCDTALTDYNGPTSAELVSEIDDVQTDIAALNDLSAADVNAEMVDVLSVDTIAELAQAAPAATPTFATALMLIYMALRNKLTITGNEKGIHNDAGTKVVKKALADDGTTYTEDEAVSGA